MKNFRDIVEARGDTAVFTFGRFNPPTTGHEKLIDALAKQQSKNAGSMMYVYPSHSQNAKKDPLPHTLKIAYMRKMFPKYKSNIIVSKSRTALEAAVELHKKGHRSIVADMAEFLLSPKASAISGQVFKMDCGIVSFKI